VCAPRKYRPADSDRVQAVQGNARRDARFFKRFPQRGLLGGFAVFHAAGNPLPAFRVVGALENGIFIGIVTDFAIGIHVNIQRLPHIVSPIC
jgi:hypothetical protein